MRTHQSSKISNSTTSDETDKRDCQTLHLGKSRKEYSLVQDNVPSMISMNKTFKSC